MDDELKEIKRKRVRYNFNRRYFNRGGIDRLMKLADECALIDDMAKEFPLTKERLSQILKVVLDMPYSVWLAQHGVSRKKVSGIK